MPQQLIESLRDIDTQLIPQDHVSSEKTISLKNHSEKISAIIYEFVQTIKNYANSSFSKSSLFDEAEHYNQRPSTSHLIRLHADMIDHFNLFENVLDKFLQISPPSLRISLLQTKNILKESILKLSDLMLNLTEKRGKCTKDDLWSFLEANNSKQFKTILQDNPIYLEIVNRVHDSNISADQSIDFEELGQIGQLPISMLLKIQEWVDSSEKTNLFVKETKNIALSDAIDLSSIKKIEDLISETRIHLNSMFNRNKSISTKIKNLNEHEREFQSLIPGLSPNIHRKSIEISENSSNNLSNSIVAKAICTNPVQSSATNTIEKDSNQPPAIFSIQQSLLYNNYFSCQSELETFLVSVRTFKSLKQVIDTTIQTILRPKLLLYLLHGWSFITTAPHMSSLINEQNRLKTLQTSRTSKKHEIDADDYYFISSEEDGTKSKMSKSSQSNRNQSKSKSLVWTFSNDAYDESRVANLVDQIGFHEEASISKISIKSKSKKPDSISEKLDSIIMFTEKDRRHDRNIADIIPNLNSEPSIQKAIKYNDQYVSPTGKGGIVTLPILALVPLMEALSAKLIILDEPLLVDRLDLSPKSQVVSRAHLEFSYDNGEFLMRETSPDSITFLNGHRIPSSSYKKAYASKLKHFSSKAIDNNVHEKWTYIKVQTGDIIQLGCDLYRTNEFPKAPTRYSSATFVLLATYLTETQVLQWQTWIETYKSNLLFSLNSKEYNLNDLEWIKDNESIASISESTQVKSSTENRMNVVNANTEAYDSIIKERIILDDPDIEYREFYLKDDELQKSGKEKVAIIRRIKEKREKRFSKRWKWVTTNTKNPSILEKSMHIHQGNYNYYQSYTRPKTEPSSPVSRKGSLHYLLKSCSYSQDDLMLIQQSWYWNSGNFALIAYSSNLISMIEPAFPKHLQDDQFAESCTKVPSFKISLPPVTTFSTLSLTKSRSLFRDYLITCSIIKKSISIELWTEANRLICSMKIKYSNMVKMLKSTKNSKRNRYIIPLNKNYNGKSITIISKDDNLTKLPMPYLEYVCIKSNFIIPVFNEIIKYLVQSSYTEDQIDKSLNEVCRIDYHCFQLYWNHTKYQIVVDTQGKVGILRKLQGDGIAIRWDPKSSHLYLANVVPERMNRHKYNDNETQFDIIGRSLFETGCPLFNLEQCKKFSDNQLSRANNTNVYPENEIDRDSNIQAGKSLHFNTPLSTPDANDDNYLHGIGVNSSRNYELNSAWAQHSCTFEANRSIQFSSILSTLEHVKSQGKVDFEDSIEGPLSNVLSPLQEHGVIKKHYEKLGETSIRPIDDILTSSKSKNTKNTSHLMVHLCCKEENDTLGALLTMVVQLVYNIKTTRNEKADSKGIKIFYGVDYIPSHLNYFTNHVDID